MLGRPVGDTQVRRRLWSPPSLRQRLTRAVGAGEAACGLPSADVVASGGQGQGLGAGEFEILARIRGRLAGGSARAGLVEPSAGEVFSGDDTAVLVPPAGRLLLAIDLVVEGVHFDLSIGSLADAGWKAISVNASDVAAMGGRPLHVVAGVSAPPATNLDEVTDGMLEACAAYGLALVGGDLTSGERLVLAVAITGTCDGRDAVLRTGARPGDVIWVTGPLGASAAGLELLRGARAAGDAGAKLAQAYRRPLARVREGVVAATSGATAMIDVSDGLSQDLGHIAAESGVGLRLTSVPVAEGASLEQALGGGEDYELVFTAQEGARVSESFEAAGLAAPTQIGRCTGEAQERSLEGRPLSLSGWEHSFRRIQTDR
jgi:thiamine-monophosphate kinase